MQKNPVYFDFVDVADEKVFTKQRMREWEVNLRNAYVDVLDEMLTNITLSGDWRGVSVTDQDDTVTLLFEGKIEPLKSFGRIVTGDASPVTYLCLLAAVSAGVLAMWAVRRRRGYR